MSTEYNSELLSQHPSPCFRESVLFDKDSSFERDSSFRLLGEMHRWCAFRARGVDSLIMPATSLTHPLPQSSCAPPFQSTSLACCWTSYSHPAEAWYCCWIHNLLHGQVLTHCGVLTWHLFLSVSLPFLKHGNCLEITMLFTGTFNKIKCEILFK